ncbi:MAG: TRAP transporter small permease subunit [Gammaproteobacteria bacterium]|nr:TRAP transporter small permease subunit [Gammaproteobacteria bacterium]
MIDAIDRLTDFIGRLVAKLAGVMVLTTCVVVALRYGFDTGAIALQESVIYMHGMLFLFGLSYTLKHDGHVRVDVLYSRMTEKRRAWVNLIGHLIFMVPLTLTIGIVSVRYAVNAWAILEGSPEVGGIQAVFLLKTLLPVSAALLLLQTIAEMTKALSVLRKQHA